MHRTDGAGATAGNLFQKGAIVTSDWMNDTVQEELCNVVEAAGLTLDKAENTQLLQAIGSIISGAGIQQLDINFFKNVVSRSGAIQSGITVTQNSAYEFEFTVPSGVTHIDMRGLGGGGGGGAGDDNNSHKGTDGGNTFYKVNGGSSVILGTGGVGGQSSTGGSFSSGGAGGGDPLNGGSWTPGESGVDGSAGYNGGRGGNTAPGSFFEGASGIGGSGYQGANNVAQAGTGYGAGGAGGAGGGGSDDAPGGGGCGGESKHSLLVAEGDVITITIGQGGAGDTSSGGAYGNGVAGRDGCAKVTIFRIP